MSEVPLYAGSAWPRPFEEMVASLEDVEWGSMLTPFNPKVSSLFGKLETNFKKKNPWIFGKFKKIFKKIFIYMKNIIFSKTILKKYLKMIFPKEILEKNEQFISKKSLLYYY